MFGYLLVHSPDIFPCIERQRAKEGVAGIFKLLWSLEKRSPLNFELFDTQLQPMRNYGAEMWGPKAGHTLI